MYQPYLSMVPTHDSFFIFVKGTTVSYLASHFLFLPLYKIMVVNAYFRIAERNDDELDDLLDNIHEDLLLDDWVSKKDVGLQLS